MTNSQMLRRAHAALLKYGWCQGNYNDHAGHICLVEALFHAAHQWEQDGSPMSAYQVLAEVVGNDYLALWNDDPSRSLPEVLAALTAAIAIAESQEHEQRRSGSMVNVVAPQTHESPSFASSGQT